MTAPAKREVAIVTAAAARALWPAAQAIGQTLEGGRGPRRAGSHFYRVVGVGERFAQRNALGL